MKRQLARLGRVCLAAMLLSAPGCAAHKPPPLPTYHGLTDAAALRVLAERAASVEALSGRCDLTLTRADGQSVQLDGAIAMAPPDRLRLRAWKFGQAVFDLTLTPQGLWVMAPEDAGRREKVLPASLSAARFGREWAMLNGGFFLQGDLTTGGDAKWLDVRRRVEDGRTILCRVDRATLTPRQYDMRDPHGALRLRLALTDYRLVSGTPWPMKLNARSGDGHIDIRLKDVELNQDLPPNAFKPPRRAERHE
jgi:outer membrane lipoprotein-sorting protein